MIVSDSKKFIFIHIPKCAGNTVRGWLRQYDTRMELFWGAYKPYSNLKLVYDLAHIDLPMLRAMVGSDTFDNYYKFCIVRDPYDRVYSSFVEALKFFPAYKQRGFKAFLVEQLEKMDFSQHKQGGNRCVHLTPQHTYVFDHDGRLLVDQVCRLDNLESELRDIAAKLDLTFPKQLNNFGIRLVNNGLPYQYMDKYDTDSIKIINEIYARDFELLDFKKL